MDVSILFLAKTRSGPRGSAEFIMCKPPIAVEYIGEFADPRGPVPGGVYVSSLEMCYIPIGS